MSPRRRRGYAEDAEAVEADERTALLREDTQHDNERDGNRDTIDRSQGWRALAWSFSGSAGFTLLSYYIPVLYAMPLFDFIPPHNLASMWGFWFTPSLNYIGQGIIMGCPPPSV